MNHLLASPQKRAEIVMNHAQRVNTWNGLLIDNESGQIVNNTSGSLHYDDHKRMLDDVVKARKYAPTVYSALIGQPGISVGVSLSDTILGYSNMNEFGAQTSMNASDRQSNQSNYRYSWVPQPIHHTDFQIPWRQDSFQYKQSDGVEESTMQVALERDRVLMQGDSSIVVDINGAPAQLYGLTNHPNTSIGAGAISDWALAVNNDNIVNETIAQMAIMFTDLRVQMPNSVLVVVANDISTNLESDYSTQKGDATIKERMMQITAIKDIIPSQWLPDGAVLFIEVSPMTLRIAQSSDITVVPWIRSNRMEPLNFTIFAAGALQVRADRNGRTGLRYVTKS